MSRQIRVRLGRLESTHESDAWDTGLWRRMMEAYDDAIATTLGVLPLLAKQYDAEGNHEAAANIRRAHAEGRIDYELPPWRSDS
ncbi:MAG: hypothetical protein KDA61_05950 [Planctomycetales bacterium]|nr:hypothetical protein [Planctomycetales bacterium]